MPELAAALEAAHGVVAAPAQLSRFLIKAGYSYKKIADRNGAWARTRSA
jgi:transposase